MPHDLDLDLGLGHMVYRRAPLPLLVSFTSLHRRKQKLDNDCSAVHQTGDNMLTFMLCSILLSCSGALYNSVPTSRVRLSVIPVAASPPPALDNKEHCHHTGISTESSTQRFSLMMLGMQV